MERLAFWTLMGLRRDGPFEVWYQLDTFPSAELAELAAGAPDWAEQGIAETRVAPYYRVDHEPELEHAQPTVGEVNTNSTAQKPIATAV